MPVEFGRTSEDLLTAEASKRFLQIISGQLNCYLFVLVVHLKDIKNFLTLSMKSSFPLSMSLYIISNSLFTAHQRNSNAFLKTQHGNIISWQLICSLRCTVKSRWWGHWGAIRPSPPFFRLALNEFPDVGSVGRIEKKKKLKKNHKESLNRRPWYPRMTLKVNIHIFGLTKCTIYCKNCSCFCWSMLLLCSFFKLKELFQEKNGLTKSLLFFFWKCQKFGSVGRR